MLDTSYFAPSGGDGSSTSEYFYFNVDPDVSSFALNFDLGTGSVVEDLGAQTIRLQRDAGLDSIYLSDYYPGGYGASLLLVGSNLFDALSPDAIVAGDVDLAFSHAYMGSYLEDKARRSAVSLRWTRPALPSGKCPSRRHWRLRCSRCA